MGPLGRRPPTDWRHVERFPLAALAAAERPVHVPMPIGINWYSNFDHPVRWQDGRWRVGAGSLGSIRGGHCVCLAPVGFKDSRAWWKFYDQGSEGACVGFGCSRCMTLLNRRRYDGRWLYRTAQLRDEWDDTPPGEGTSVRAGGETMRVEGLRYVRGVWRIGPSVAEGISAYRWVTDMNDVLRTLGRTDGAEVPFLNSWGVNYPRVVWMPVSVLDRLYGEDGELMVVTDR